MRSLWEETSDCREFGRLDGSRSTDVLIIGGGIAGILCAYMLDAAGADYMLVEAERIGCGITRNTTAKITSQHGLIYDRLIRMFGVENARQYLEINQLALKKYRELCKNIDCDFEEKDSFIYSLDDRAVLEKEISALDLLGFNADYSQELPLPFPTVGAVRFRDQAQFNPLRFLYSVATGLNIFENTTVRELVGTSAVTDCGTVKAKKIIVATHFPFLNKHGSYFLKMYQHRSYVLALSGAPDMNGMYADEAQNGLSFRNSNDLLIVGGGSHRTGKKGGGWNELRAFISRDIPQAEEKYHWAAQDCMTLDGVPYIGRYSAGTEDLFVATGFNKWGITSSMAAAMILSDLVQEKPNPYAAVFSPSRTMLRPQLAVNAFESVVNLLTPSVKRCPHLGCALKWNPVEHTWDCPCHGSRFTEDGRLIDNPATGGLK